MSSNTARVREMDAEAEGIEVSASETHVSIPELMAQIRERIKEDVATNRDKRPQFSSKNAEFNTTPRQAKELLYSDELRYLNEHYAHSMNPPFESISSHRPSIIGKLIVKTKKKIGYFIWNLFKDYLVAEREFNAHVVRYLNDVSKYVDARDAQNFWELIRKIDVDVGNALRRIESINDEQGASLRTLERQLHEALRASGYATNKTIATLEAEVARQGQEQKVLASVTSGLESITARYGNRDTSSAIEAGDSIKGETAPSEMPDCSYLMLENRFRGSEEEVSKRLEVYPPLFSEAIKEHSLKGPVLEIGPGRGELLTLFKDAGIEASGIDVDQAMVDVCKEKGFSVSCGDGIKHLQSHKGGLSGIIAVQVVEHLSRKQLQELFKACREKVAAGGIVIFETIDPRSLQALSSNYFRDPTHVWPLHPETLAYAMELEGLKVKEVKNLSPVPKEACLQAIPESPAATPVQRELVERVNANINQLNALLYGYQDYCIVAEVQ